MFSLSYEELTQLIVNALATIHPYTNTNEVPIEEFLKGMGYEKSTHEGNVHYLCGYSSGIVHGPSDCS